MDSPDKVLNSAGISTVPLIKKKSTYEPFICEICCDDDPDLEILSLACGHTFCKNCFVYYTSQKIKEAENKPIQCPQDRCNIVMDEKTIGILVESDMNERYLVVILTFLFICYL